MATYIVLKNNIGGELSENAVLAEESIDSALTKLLQSGQPSPLNKEDTNEVIAR